MRDGEHSDGLAVAKLDATLKDTTCTKPITSSRFWLEVRDVMSQDVATVSPDQTVISASMIMAERRVSCVVAVDRTFVVGVLTETDLLKKIVVAGKDFYEKPVATVMSKSVVSVSEHVSVLSASQTMEAKHIKRLPILADEKLVGIVTQTDLTRALAEYGRWRDVSEIMSSNLCTMQSNESVAAAAKAMASNNISSIIAMQDEKPVGILTQRDFFTKILAKGKDPQHTKIEDAMSSPPVCVPPNYSIHSSSRTMEDLKIRRLVIMDDGKLLGIVTQSDIFAAIRRKLQAEEAKNLLLLEKSPCCTFTTDLEGKTTYVNPAFARLFEVSDPQDLVGGPFLSDPFWVDPSERSLLMGGYTNWKFDTSELALKSAKGKNLYVSVFSSFTTDSHGVINGRQGIVYDLTERTESEKHNDALIQHLTESNSELENFVSRMSHDLKTPIRELVTLADWITTEYRDKLDEEGTEKLELLRKRANGIVDRVDGMLRYCRLGGDNEGWVEVDLMKQVSMVIDMLEVPNHIEITIEGQLPVLHALPTQINQIFQNLLSNAIKFMDKPRGRISIRCSEEDRFWKFELSDNGPGIEEGHFDRIFKMFQTLTAGEESESTGIGLALAKKSVEVHGGTLWVESVLGQGSAFIFTLPKEREKLGSVKSDALAIPVT